MPRCEVCKEKFVAKFFNQKNCLSENCKKNKTIKKTAKKVKKSKTVTTDYTLFFEEGIEEVIERPVCENCGGTISSGFLPHWNVAHILPKSKYKSVATHPENRITLCAQKDNTGRNCHADFDNNIKEIPNMQCFGKVKEKFEKFKGEVEERGVLFFIFEEN